MIFRQFFDNDSSTYTYLVASRVGAESLIIDPVLEKTDIFCLTIDNKLAEAKLLNSLLKDTEETIDTSFQKLFEYMISENKENLKFNSDAM